MRTLNSPLVSVATVPLVLSNKPIDHKRNKTVTRSFRIDEYAFNALQEEADKRSISVNTLLNQLVVRYASHDRFLQKLLGFYIPGEILRDLLKAVPDEKLLELAKRHGEYGASVTYTYKGQFGIEPFLDVLRTSLKYMPLEYSETVHGSKHVFTINHEMGTNFTVYISNLFKNTLDILKVKTRITVSGDNTIVFEME